MNLAKYVVHHSKGLGKSFLKMYVLIKSSDQNKSYENLSMIFLFFTDLLSNMTMSRDTDSLFLKICDNHRFPH